MMPNQTPDLSQLKDIHLPNAITEWPISFGWWLLLIAIIIATVSGIYFWQRERKKSATKRAALLLLNHQYEQFKENGNSQLFLQQSNQILKRYCLDKYPEAISLSGPAWTNFLIRHCHKTFLNADLANALGQGIYQTHCEYDASDLHKACTSWLNNNKSIQTKNSLIANDALDTGSSND